MGIRQPKPSAYVNVHLSRRRLDRIWQRVESSSNKRVVNYRLVAAAAVLAVVGLGIWYVRAEPPVVAVDIDAEARPQTDDRLVSEPSRRPASSTAPEDSGNPAPSAPRATGRVLPPRAPVTARDLWAEAQASRLAGEAADAARAFDALRRRFPDDSRSGLAALELGRIRLDSLGDPDGALEAFDFALAHGNEAFFTEDAAAGRVEALSRMGSLRACLRARGAFLQSHPNSAHAARVSRMCPVRP